MQTFVSQSIMPKSTTHSLRSDLASFPKFRKKIKLFASFLNYELPDRKQFLLGGAGGRSPWGREEGRWKSEGGEGGRGVIYGARREQESET